MAKKSSRYAMYEPRDLLKRWKLEKLSVEHAVGQLILRLMDLIKRLARVKARQLVFKQELRDFRAWLDIFDERLRSIEEREHPKN